MVLIQYLLKYNQFNIILQFMFSYYFVRMKESIRLYIIFHLLQSAIGLIENIIYFE
jgi:hypothetical protein